MESPHLARTKLLFFGVFMRQRDALVIDAYDAGLSKTDIHRATGLSRPTIDRIIEGYESVRTKTPHD